MSSIETGSPAIGSDPLPPAAPPPRRRLWRRALRGLWLCALGLLMTFITAWAALILLFANTHTGPRYVLALAYVLTAIAIAALVRPRRLSLAVVVILFGAVLGWYSLIKPSNDRIWSPDVAKLPFMQFDGNQLTVHNVRDFEWRSDDDFTQKWEDRTYDLNTLRTADFALCHWGSKAIAHAIVSFGFDDGRYLAVSIEARRESTESYSAVQGFFRQYELIYVVADERDVLRVRTNCRNEDLYLFRTRLNPQEARAVLLSYAEHINALHERPEFYNALTTNCVTSLVPHAQAGHPAAHIGWQLLLSGYAARQAYENGNLDDSLPFEQLEARGRITDKAIAADKDPDFSNKIREGLPSPMTDPTNR